MDATRFEDLLMRWQDGDASAEENREFEGLLRDNPEFRRALVGSVLLEAGLHRRYTTASLAPAQVPSRKRIWEAAAALLVVAVSLFAVGRLLFRGDDLALVSGTVWSQGAPAAALHDGQAFEIRGLAPATLQLRDGTRVILDAGSAGTLPAGPKPFELSRGSGSFQIDAAAFRVSTPAGGLSASNAQVWILLRPSSHKAVKRPELVVETTRGSVDVDAWEIRATVPEGGRRVFGPPPPAGGVDYTALLDGATFSLSAAIGKVQAAGGGVPVHAELEMEDGRAAFSVGLAVENHEREIALDPKTGKVLQDEVEQEDHSRIVAALKIPLQTLIDKVLETTTGRAVEAELELKGGRLRAEIKVYGPEGLREVKVDAETGEILSTKAAEKKENSK